jgi:hypothetical protein
MSQYEPGVTAPPFHVYCRSTTVPYFGDEFDNIGERAARGEDGKTYHVPADMTYKDWQKSFVDGDKSGLKEVKPDDTIKVKNAVKTVDDCTTTEEVQEMMKEQNWFRSATIGGKVFDTNESLSLAGIDVDVAKSIYRTHDTLFTKYPQLVGKLNSISSAKLSGGTYAQCSFGLGHGGVTVNKQYYGNLESLKKHYEGDLAAGFHPAGTDYTAVVMHELGHAVDDYLSYTEMASGMVNSWKPKIVSADLRPKVMKACKLKISDIGKSVSGYATKDAQEWFAECFAEYMCSDEPRPVATEFGKQFEEMMKGVK